MPELPEVETVRTVLEKNYLNETIINVDVFYEKILANISSNDFINNLKNQTIISFSRKGKYLIVNLSNSTLLIHLRMEGKFKFSKDLFDKHSHIMFSFASNKVLIYHDVRKFGRIFYFKKEDNIYDLYPLNKLGLEPFEVKNPKYLYDKIHNLNKPIKSVLLDQSILAGIGNIYADEICFATRINPMHPACNITLKQCQEIIDKSIEILNAAILDGGSSVKTFQSSHGVDGLFQLKLKVYGKENTPCCVCHNLIIKTFVAKRGTHYCPFCQKE
ncbi:MAG: DNA-formamidopyrimidine glycosylase [Erysipelotrichaceae bacterium]|nr:DNA-formamidopyrimidine glycosylase [Erysipelotrichaceae bacterium]